MPRRKNLQNTFKLEGVLDDRPSVKKRARRKPISTEQLSTINPITENQEKVFQAWSEGKKFILHGCAGTGKTFGALYLALKEVLDPETPYEKIYIVRSLVPTREIGFLPGDHEDKS